MKKPSSKTLHKQVDGEYHPLVKFMLAMKDWRSAIVLMDLWRMEKEDIDKAYKRKGKK